VLKSGMQSGKSNTRKVVNIFCPEELIDWSHRSEVFELVRSKERLSRKDTPVDHTIQSAINWTEDVKSADLIILPMSWNYHYNEKNANKAWSFLEEVKLLNTPIWSATTGDHGISLQRHEKLRIYRVSGYRSRIKTYERILPPFFTDPIITHSDYLESSKTKIRKPNSPITVGFCGNAPKDLYHVSKEMWAFARHNLQGTLGWHKLDTHPVKSTSILRNKVLDAFYGHKSFTTNYIRRSKYRAGARNASERQKTKIEFLNNILESDLIPCVRGAGNFSVRFYETLAMGRIPLFCDTDSPLPEIDGDWDDHIIRFTPKDIPDLPDLTMQWLQGKDMKDVFRRNRQLWEEQLSLQGFWTKEIKRLQGDF
jgi:hypothetical protein